MITLVGDNNVKKIIDVHSKIEDIVESNTRGVGSILLYQIDPALNPKIPPIEQVGKTDSNYGVSEEWTKIVVNNVSSFK